MMRVPGLADGLPPSPPPGLQRLPYEIVSNIALSLTLDSLFDLALCSRHFQYVIRENNFCRIIVMAKMPFSLEAEEAARDGRYAQALRRLVKRRRAVAQASPYAVAVLGVADAFGLYGGTVCYILEDRPQRWLRILDLQAAPDHEIVVDVPGLVRASVPGAGGGGGSSGGGVDDDYTFRLVHHAHGITSCLYSRTRADATEQQQQQQQQQQQHWLLIFDARANRVRGAVRLESAARLFVRNTAEVLYFGTHSEPGADGFRRWVVRCFDLGAGRLSPRRIHLAKVAGHELGATVCFELVDGYFYGVTNATTFEPEEIDWTSYYHCFRFRVAADPDPEGVEVMRERDSWRRQHDEGPIDDRWTSLRLEKDEATGRLRIVESRREWLGGTSHSRRACYATDVVFPPAEEAGTGGGAGVESGRPGGGGGGGYDLPDVPLAGLLESDDKPNYMPAPARLPHNVHVGDEGAAPFLCSQTHLRSYFYASGTFLDLVDDPAPAAPYTQRLRLRALTRTAAANGAPLAPGRRTPGVEPEKEPNIISMWPPAGPGVDAAAAAAAADDDYNARLALLQRTMNPENLCGAVRAVNDDRSLVYETGGAGEPKALVYISFDPAVRLAGMGYVGSLPGELIREGADGEGVEPPATVDPKGKGKGKAAVGRAYMAPAAPTGHSTPTTTATGPACQQESPAPILAAAGAGPTWRRVDKAFHRELSLCKYTFGL